MSLYLNKSTAISKKSDRSEYTAYIIAAEPNRRLICIDYNSLSTRR